MNHQIAQGAELRTQIQAQLDRAERLWRHDMCLATPHPVSKPASDGPSLAKVLEVLDRKH